MNSLKSLVLGMTLVCGALSAPSVAQAGTGCTVPDANNPYCYCTYAFTSTYGDTNIPDVSTCELPYVKLEWSWAQEHGGGHDKAASDVETVVISDLDRPLRDLQIMSVRLLECQYEDWGWYDAVSQYWGSNCQLWWDNDTHSGATFYAYTGFNFDVMSRPMISFSSKVNGWNPNADSYKAKFALLFRNLNYTP